jgi:hypothetical protein
VNRFLFLIGVGVGCRSVSTDLATDMQILVDGCLFRLHKVAAKIFLWFASIKN